MTNRWSSLKFLLLVCCLAVCSCRSVCAQDQFPTHVPFDKKELDIWKHDQVLGRTDATRDSIIKIDELRLATRGAQCSLVVVNQRFCDCLNDLLPLKVGFLKYVEFVLGIESLGTSNGKSSYKFDKSLALTSEEETAAFSAMLTCQTLHTK